MGGLTHCLAPVDGRPGRSWAAPSTDGSITGLVQYFTLNFEVGISVDDANLTRAALFFPEPVVVDDIVGGRAYVADCATCPSISSQPLDANCLSWCSKWTCTAFDCLGCGSSIGCFTPPPPPAPAPTSPPPLTPGEHPIVLALLTSQEWTARVERESRYPPAAGLGAAKAQTKLAHRLVAHARDDGPGYVELRGHRLRPVESAPHLEDATSLRSVTPTIGCHSARESALLRGAGHELPRRPPTPPPPYPRGELHQPWQPPCPSTPPSPPRRAEIPQPYMWRGGSHTAPSGESGGGGDGTVVPSSGLVGDAPSEEEDAALSGRTIRGSLHRSLPADAAAAAALARRRSGDGGAADAEANAWASSVSLAEATAALGLLGVLYARHRRRWRTECERVAMGSSFWAFAARRVLHLAPGDPASAVKAAFGSAVAGRTHTAAHAPPRPRRCGQQRVPTHEPPMDEVDEAMVDAMMGTVSDEPAFAGRSRIDHLRSVCSVSAEAAANDEEMDVQVEEGEEEEEEAEGEAEPEGEVESEAEVGGKAQHEREAGREEAEQARARRATGAALAFDI